VVVLGEQGRRLRFLLRDAKFTRAFDEVVGSEGAQVLLAPVQTPNAYAERWIRTVHAVCLNWLLIIGRGHLDQVLRVNVEHYNAHRPHRGLRLEPPVPRVGPTAVTWAQHRVRRHDLLGRVTPPAYPLEACYRPPGSPVGSVGLRRQGASS
jgi:putative transposase